MMRRRLPPSAARTAISRDRPRPRASSRFATFAHAISSTNATTPASTSDVVRSSGPTIASRSGSMVTPQPLLVSGAIDRDAIGDAGHVGPRLLERDARLQPADDLHVVLAPLLGAAPHREQRPHVGAERESGTTAGTTPTIVYGWPSSVIVAADDRRIAAEAVAPQPLADHHHASAGCAVSSAVNVAPAIGRMPSDVEELPGDRLAGNPLGFAAAAGQRPPAAGDRRDRRERLLLLAPVEKVQRRDAVVREARRALPEHDEAIGLGEGEGTDERGVHQAEHRAVGADADGEHDDGDRGEAGRAPERAGGVAEVAPDRHAA